MKMSNTTGNQTVTLESVWEAFRDTDRRMKETDRRMKATGEQMKDTDRRIKETDRLIKEIGEQIKESNANFEKRMKKFDETVGSWANNQGAFAEEYFFNSFENGRQNFFGEKYDRIMKNVKGLDYVIDDEYDILLINGKSVGIVEVKFKVHENDIPKVIRKAETFRVNHPNYTNHQIYLGLATMAFYPGLEQECISRGIAVIKQVGDTVVINDTHLRAY